MFIFDTCIFSYALRQHTFANFYKPELEAGPLSYLSAQTLEEIAFFAEVRKWGDVKRQSLESALSKYVILPIDAETARICANIRFKAKSLGRALMTQDAWIMATAKQYELTLVSHDGDFLVAKDVGIDLICRR